jgi:hypothetical protein
MASNLHPRPVECISTCSARRSECSSPPHGPYHSRRRLWKTTQVSKTTPAATDGSNIKFSSVTELFLSSAQPPEERCSDRPRAAPRSPRFCLHTHGRTVANTQSLSPRRRLWTLPRQLWCTSTNAIGWPFFKPLYRRLLDKSSMPWKGKCAADCTSLDRFSTALRP